MNEERAQILEMLVAGRLTVEQADQLLQAIDVPSSPAHQPATSEMGTQRRRVGRSDNFFASLTAEQLIALRDNGVSGAYVEQMRAAGLNGLRAKDLIKLHDHGVTPRFVLDLQEAGLADLTRDQLIDLFCHGVNADYVREMSALGLAGATPDQLIEMYDHGVDVAFVREMRSRGYTDLTPAHWVSLRDDGVEDDSPAEGGLGMTLEDAGEGRMRCAR
ncbi:MAG TPA: hypothetical protein VF040_14735 [Ktedonobacterales bacterium]